MLTYRLRHTQEKLDVLKRLKGRFFSEANYAREDGNRIKTLIYFGSALVLLLPEIILERNIRSLKRDIALWPEGSSL